MRTRKSIELDPQDNESLRSQSGNSESAQIPSFHFVEKESETPLHNVATKSLDGIRSGSFRAAKSSDVEVVQVGEKAEQIFEDDGKEVFGKGIRLAFHRTSDGGFCRRERKYENVSESENQSVMGR